MTKSEIRKITIIKRAHILNKEEKDACILKKVTECDFYETAKTVMVYISQRGEVGTEELIKKLAADGKTLCAPVCIDKETMVAKKFSSLDELIAGAYNIPEPQGEQIFNIDLVIVPGVAFNEGLHRIGYGAGYYDRFLEKTNAVTCGLFYEKQKADFLPDSHDKRLDYIITEEKIYS